MGKLLAALLLGTVLLAAGPAGVGPAPAGAQSCLPSDQAPRLGIPELSHYLGQIRAVTGGYDAIVYNCLRQVGGRYLYQIKVDVGRQSLVDLTIDTASGQIIR